MALLSWGPEGVHTCGLLAARHSWGFHSEGMPDVPGEGPSDEVSRHFFQANF